jgi:hypothetical protein
MDQAIAHQYAAKSHALFLKMLKETICPDTEAVILLDSSENYLF